MALDTAAPLAAADPLRPVFHFQPPAQWMNDICGVLWHEGWYHIFYPFTRVAIPPSPALHLEAAATGGAATLRAVTAWPIEHRMEKR